MYKLLNFKWGISYCFVWEWPFLEMEYEIFTSLKKDRMKIFVRLLWHEAAGFTSCNLRGPHSLLFEFMMICERVDFWKVIPWSQPNISAINRTRWSFTFVWKKTKNIQVMCFISHRRLFASSICLDKKYCPRLKCSYLLGKRIENVFLAVEKILSVAE